MTPEAGSSRTERTERLVLVVVNDTTARPELPAAIDLDPGGGDSKVHVVVPALNSRVRHWFSDEDGARRSAEQRLQTCLGELDRAGIDATGSVGDREPLQAIADALTEFAADEIVIASAPERQPVRPDADVVAGQASRRFGLPVARVSLLAGRQSAAPASGPGEPFLTAA